MATLDARAPATQPPSPPKLLVGSPSPDGGAQIEFLPNADPGEEVIRYELWRSTLLPGASSEPSSSSGASNTVQAPAPTAHMVHSSTSSSSNTTPQASGLSGATSSLTANKLQRIAIGPATAQLAGSAARYGVTLHQPVMAAVSRTGASMAASIQTSLLQGHMVAQINSTDLPTGSNTGAWLTDAPAGLDWRRDYAYVVKAIDKDGLESVSEPVDLTPLKVKAGPPANVTATLNARTCAVDVAWQSTEPATAGFVVERQLLTRAGSASTAGPSSSTGHAITAQGTNAAIASTYHPPGATTAFAVTQMNGPDYIQLSQMIPQTRYTDASVFPDNSYVYRVRTVDQAGNVSVPTAIPQNIAIPDGCGTTTALQESSSTLRTPQKGNTTESTQQSVASTAVPPEQSLASTSTQPPTFSANAAAASIPVNGVTTLSFHFQNTTSSPLTGLALTSQLPAGLVIALPNAVTNTCGGTASAPPWMNSITLSGAILAPNASCIVSVNVTGTSAGQKQVSASFSYSGASPVTSNGATITVLPASPKPGNPPNPQPQPNPPPTRKRVVAA
jgi:hypothetical protein